MTFRGRLRLFFTIIVIVPMVAIAAVLFTLTADSERGKADAGIATGINVGFSLYGEGRAAAARDLRRMAGDRRLNAALSAGDEPALRSRLRQIVRQSRRIVSATLADSSGRRLASAGSPRGVAPASGFLVAARGGRRVGTLGVSVTDARRLARTAARRTRLEFLVFRGGRRVATTVPGIRDVAKGSSDFEAGGRDYRGRRVLAAKPNGVEEEIAVFRRSDDLNSAITDSRTLIGTIIVAFLLLALATSVFVGRALQGQIGQFLEAARRLAGGRFDQRVPTEGGDEFAQLGREFNSMSEQLEVNIREVERQRNALEGMIRRVGSAMSAGLDTQGVFDLTVQTAVDACRAEIGRAMPLDRTSLHETRAGRHDPALVGVLEEAERSAFAVGPQTRADMAAMQAGALRRANGRGPTPVQRGEAHALALPLRARLGSRTFASDVGVLSIARRGLPFARSEAEMLEYLASQAMVSFENADLHETVQQQAITDELTGLSNRRQMERALDREFDRRRRFETPLGLVLLDIDDFKKVNDTFGHPQGDEVLVQVARVLREESRDIDEPIRMGGEEFAVLLPQTDLKGAAELAERTRTAIQELRIPRLDEGPDLRVTSSFGVAAVPGSASDKQGLIAVADAALLRAKRAGKNRVERADDVTRGSELT